MGARTASAEPTRRSSSLWVECRNWPIDCPLQWAEWRQRNSGYGIRKVEPSTVKVHALPELNRTLPTTHISVLVLNERVRVVDSTPPQ